MTTIIGLWFFGKKFFNPRLAFCFALFASLPLLSVFSACWWHAQAETFMLPLSVLSVLLAGFTIKSEKKSQQFFFSLLSGLVFSQILALKPSGFWLGLGLLLFLVRFSPEKKKTLFSYGLGIFLGLGVWLFYFWLRGIVREFLEEVVLFNWFHLAGTRGSVKYLMVLFSWELWKLFGPALVFVPVGLVGSFRKRQKPEYFLGLLWFLLSLIEVLFQARFFLYHLILLIPSWAIIIALASEEFKIKGSRVLMMVNWLIILLWLYGSSRLYFLIQRHYQTSAYLRGKITQGQYYARFQEPLEGTKRDFNLYASWVVAGWIRERTSPKDYVMVFGYEPGINYLSGRRAPSRFHSDYPLNFQPGNKFALSLREKFRKTFLTELEQRKPRLVVLVHNDINALESEDSYRQAQDFKEFWEWLIENYQLGERIEDFEFWWRIE